MRKLILTLFVLSLNGCAVIDALLMTKYDPNEYLLITQIRTDAQVYKKQCGNHLFAAVNAQSIANKTDLFEKYEELIPRNENLINSSKSLNQIAQGLATAYIDPKGEPSATFCRLKYGSIENAAYVMQHVVGDRPR